MIYACFANQIPNLPPIRPTRVPERLTTNTQTLNTTHHRADDIINEREKNKLLQEEMETTLHDIQNM